VTIIAILSILAGIGMFLAVILAGLGGVINPRLDTGGFLAISVILCQRVSFGYHIVAVDVISCFGVPYIAENLSNDISSRTKP
jgi:hypothetical protein